MMNEPRDVLLPVEDAKAEILVGISMLGAERISVAAAHGRVLAGSGLPDHPATKTCVRDGWLCGKVGRCDTSSDKVENDWESAAGTSFSGSIGPGQTVRIFTGAVLPEGSDAIVIQENTDADGDQITFHEAASAGRYVRPQGLDFEKGQVLINPAQLSIPDTWLWLQA